MLSAMVVLVVLDAVAVVMELAMWLELPAVCTLSMLFALVLVIEIEIEPDGTLPG